MVQRAGQIIGHICMLSSNLSQREFLFFLKALKILPLKLKSYHGFLSNQWSIYSKREQRFPEEKVQIQSFVVSFKYYAHRLIKFFFLFCLTNVTSNQEPFCLFTLCAKLKLSSYFPQQFTHWTSRERKQIIF